MEVLTEFHEVILRVQVDKLIKDKREYNGRSNVFFVEKKWAKKPTQELILESWSETKKVYFWVLDHFPMTKPIHRSQERPLRLQEDFLETHRRLGISQAARALKIDTDLPGCILGTSIMSKTTKTPLRNPQRPLRLQG